MSAALQNIPGYTTQGIPSDPQGIFSYVLQRDGKIPAEIARRFVNHVMHGTYRCLTGPLKLSELPQECQTSLYEAIAYDPHGKALDTVAVANKQAPPTATCLNALNLAIGRPTKIFDRQMARLVHAFNNDPVALTWTQKRWEAQGFSGSYQGQRDRHLLQFTSLKESGSRKFAKFQAEAFAAFVKLNARHLGLEPEDFEDLECKFIKEKPELGGNFAHAEDGQPVLNLNQNASHLAGNWARVENVSAHEIHHYAQIALAKKLRRGGVPADHPLYHAARIYSANCAAYLEADGTLGHQAYQNQQLEQGAWAIGGLAERSARARQRQLQDYTPRFSANFTSPTAPTTHDLAFVN